MSNSNSDDPEEMLKDDFEEVLRQNLNLRRELATEIGKVRVPKQGMHRLGWTLYWICLTLAAVWVLMSLQLVPTDDWAEMGWGVVIWFSPVLVLIRPWPSAARRHILRVAIRDGAKSP